MEQLPQSKRIKFKYSYGVKQDIKEVTMRPPRVRDKLLAQRNSPQGNDYDIEIELMANLCEIERETVEEMFDCDYLALQEAYSSFL